MDSLKAFHGHGTKVVHGAPSLSRPYQELRGPANALSPSLFDFDRILASNSGELGGLGGRDRVLRSSELAVGQG